MKKLLILLCLGVLFAGCASPVPPIIKETPDGNPLTSEVRSDVPRFIGSRVRWGGEIITVTNRGAETWFEILALPLHKNGRPDEEGDNLGRFLVQTKGFYDPQVYRRGQMVTVVGIVDGVEVRPIGEFPYR